MEVYISQKHADPTIKVLATKCEEYRTKYGNNTLVLLSVANTYECYNETAEELHKFCKFPIIYYGDIPFVDFKKECDIWVFPKLVREGFKLCIIEP